MMIRCEDSDLLWLYNLSNTIRIIINIIYDSLKFVHLLPLHVCVHVNRLIDYNAVGKDLHKFLPAGSASPPVILQIWNYATV